MREKKIVCLDNVCIVQIIRWLLFAGGSYKYKNTNICTYFDAFSKNEIIKNLLCLRGHRVEIYIVLERTQIQWLEIELKIIKVL